MRVRKLDADSDMQLGHGRADFLVNSREAVAQMIKTRLALFQGEWFLDVTAGTPWTQEVVGAGNAARRDPAIRERILGTTGVRAITAYASTVVGRRLSVQVTVDTLYGSTNVSQAL